MKKIKLVISDWDGVFNNVKYYDENSTVKYKTYRDIDMTAIKCFMSINVDFVVLSGDPWNINLCNSRKIPMYESRGKDGILNKGEIIKNIMENYGVSNKETLYIGDDVFDIPAMKEVFYVACPSDASMSVIDYVDGKHKGYSVVLKRKGGNGCVDELFWNCLKLNQLKEKEINYKKLLELDRKQMT